ncbi:MAG: hypothetical protein N2234_02530 [Planctomycetota bacterium]|nr:hypothetical protein [Planctomycetota bacterium]
MALPRSARRRLGTLLVAEGVVNEEQLKYALDEQKRTGKPLGMVFVELGYISEENLAKTLAEQLQVPFIDPTIYTIDQSLMKTVPADLMHRYQFVPLDRFGNVVTIAAAGMPDERVESFFRDVLGCEVMLYISTYTAMRSMLSKYAPLSKEQEVEVSEKRKGDAERISERLKMESSGKLRKASVSGEESVGEVSVEEVDSKKVEEKVPVPIPVPDLPVPPPPPRKEVFIPPPPPPPLKEVKKPPVPVPEPLVAQPPVEKVSSMPRAPEGVEETRTEELSISGISNENDIDWQGLFDDIDKKVREEVKKKRERQDRGKV